ncbi:D-Ala-D-Ala carboxypeptidase family metallohydrolase [Plantactinospora sp. GCM10030261]|uniref:D-Ala-D-Ala carboxypeptidase family metallohydrolase n=1 Tax=Plantactinospora sp. GCM10030261 TaxID=3273420 RepID=UPI00361E3198
MRVPGWRRAVLAVAATAALSAAGIVGTATPAAADGCYTWQRTLREGRTGADVRQLQIRVAGWGGYGGTVVIDGIYGPRTAAAVGRFQAAYGLRVDGIAGRQTYRTLYELQDDDCTPAHFSYLELDDGCGGSGWDGGPLSPSATRANALRMMWKLEALRRSLGDHPLFVTSGFRSRWCNARVGGATRSQHLYGFAVDLVSPRIGLCALAREARSHGFSGILGPGYPGHGTHVHLDAGTENPANRESRYWYAPTCGFTGPLSPAGSPPRQDP